MRRWSTYRYCKSPPSCDADIRNAILKEIKEIMGIDYTSRDIPFADSDQFEACVGVMIMKHLMNPENAFGMIWKVTSTVPENAINVNCPALSTSLKTKTQFSCDELSAMGLSKVCKNSFAVSGDNVFVPKRIDVSVFQESAWNLFREMNERAHDVTMKYLSVTSTD
jgi:hypothetical protein